MPYAVDAVNSAISAAPVSAAPEIQEGAACYLRPGDPGFEECEACQ
jgi:ribonucleoside-diphosphate reductase alpha chain